MACSSVFALPLELLVSWFLRVTWSHLDVPHICAYSTQFLEACNHWYNKNMLQSVLYESLYPVYFIIDSESSCPLSRHVSRRHSPFGDLTDLAHALEPPSWGFSLPPPTNSPALTPGVSWHGHPPAWLPCALGLFPAFLVTADHSGLGYPTNFLAIPWATLQLLQWGLNPTWENVLPSKNTLYFTPSQL